MQDGATEWYYYCQEPAARPPDHLNVKAEGKAPHLSLGVLWVTRTCLEATICPDDIRPTEKRPGDICPGYLFLLKFVLIFEDMEHFFFYSESKVFCVSLSPQNILC